MDDINVTPSVHKYTKIFDHYGIDTILRYSIYGYGDPAVGTRWDNIGISIRIVNSAWGPGLRCSRPDLD